MEPSTRTFYLGNSCHVCKSPDTLHACGVCGMIFYCSKDHRREDWAEHSEICRVVNKICEAGNVPHLYGLYNGGDFIQFRHQIASRCTQLLGRNLKPWEFEMIYYTRVSEVCDVCREFDWRKLESCSGCRFVYTCGKHHFREDHPKWCKTLKNYSDIIIRQSVRGPAGVRLPQIENRPYKSMADVFSKTGDDEDKLSEVEDALSSEVLTYPLTVLNAVQRLGILHQKRLEIVFVGAESQAEVEPLEKWEKYLLHALNNLDELMLRFLGPELRATTGGVSWNLCEICRKRGRTLRCEFITGKFYHECRGGQPDLICALNSGMYRDFGFGNENSWERTIVELFSHGSTPVLVTEYTEKELEMDLERVGKLCGEVVRIVEPGRNPFAGLKPGLNIISWEQIPVIFKNHFYVILQNKRC